MGRGGLVRRMLTGTMIIATGVWTAATAAPAAAAPASAAQASAPAQQGAAAPSDTWLPKPASYPSENGLALTPPMGWNDWSYYQCNISQSLILSEAHALITSGLARDGYRYVNVDDCWPAMSRDANGNLVADPAKFPNGIAWLAAQIHAMGLKFGIYEDAGTNTCGGYPGSWDHFQQDADTFASWGVDYLKLDGCNVPSVSGQTTEQTYLQAYSAMSAALKATGRPIVFSESAPAYFLGTSNWATVLGWVGQYGNLWREGNDIALGQYSGATKWESILTNYGYNVGLTQYAGPGHWNDPDFLIVGDSGLTTTQMRSQISLWAEMAAPLISSTDLTALTPQALSVLSNKSVIAVDQDRYGAQATRVAQEGNVDILAKPLANGDISVVLFNKGNTAANASISAHDAGFSISPRGYLLDNLWTHNVTETASVISANVPANGVVMYRVTPVSSAHRAAPATALTVTSPPLLQGASRPTTVTLTDNGLLPVRGAKISLTVPSGWTANATSATRFSIVRPGQSVTASYSVTPASSTPPGSVSELGAVASYSWASGPGQVSAVDDYTTPYPNLAAAFNNIAITNESNPDPADLNGGFDSGGDTYSQQALDAAVGVNGATLSDGAAPGSAISYNGATFTMPDVAAGTPDNVEGGGAVVALSGSGTGIAFLGSEAGSVHDTVTVTYTDGSTSTGQIGFPGWCCDASATDWGSTAIVQSDHRDTPSGPANYGLPYDLYYNSFPITPGKTVATITLPTAVNIHIFAVAIR